MPSCAHVLFHFCSLATNVANVCLTLVVQFTPLSEQLEYVAFHLPAVENVESAALNLRVLAATQNQGKQFLEPSSVQIRSQCSS